MSENIIAILSQDSIVGKEHINVHCSMYFSLCLWFVLLELQKPPCFCLSNGGIAVSSALRLGMFVPHPLAYPTWDFPFRKPFTRQNVCSGMLHNSHLDLKSSL